MDNAVPLCGPEPSRNGLPPVPSVADFLDRALDDARRIARRRDADPRRRPRRAQPADGAARPGGYSGSGPDERDPQPVGRVLRGLVDERGWQRALQESRLFTDWPAIVGRDVAAHCRPVALRDGVLSLEAESTAWATQLRHLSATLRARIAEVVGAEVVTGVRIAGPVAPSWRHGRWSVRGAGPRDTYG